MIELSVFGVAVQPSALHAVHVRVSRPKLVNQLLLAEYAPPHAVAPA